MPVERTFCRRVSGFGGGAAVTTFGVRTLLLAVLRAVAPVASGHAADGTRNRAADCNAPDATYRNYDCLHAYLGDGFFERLINYCRLDWGLDGPPPDPKAPPSRRAGWPDPPQSSPPMPFTEWPYGGTSHLGATRPAS